MERIIILDNRLILALLLVHCAATLFMTGLIWYVQVVHYPLMNRVPADQFSAFEEAHMRLTTWVVAPAMLLELSSAVIVLLAAPRQVLVLGWTGLGLLAVIWLSTVLLQMPDHQRLLVGFNAAAHRHLVRSNWIRTFAWTIRSSVVLLMTARLV